MKVREASLRRYAPWTRPVAAGLALAGVVGCGVIGQPSPATRTKNCYEVTMDGEKVRPTVYPLGVVSVYYADYGSVNGSTGDNETSGVITRGPNDKGYELLVRDEGFISDVQGTGDDGLYPLQSFNGSSNIGAYIPLGFSTPATSELGLTTGCASVGTANGLPTVIVKLPSANS